jgi:hypothetical protein
MEVDGMITEMRHWAEAISKAYDMTAWGHTQRAAEILKQTRNRICAAIAEAEKQEPAPGYCKHCKQYTIEEPLAAAQRQWVGLTDDDFQSICANFRVAHGGWVDMLVLQIEAKLKEKNIGEKT